MNKVKLVELENQRQLHIGSHIVILNESDYQELIDIFSNKSNNINNLLPPVGLEVIGYNEKWIDEDFNPFGTRVCYIDDYGDWWSAKWDNDQDTWHTHTKFWCENGKDFSPTHWKYKPNFK